MGFFFLDGVVAETGDSAVGDDLDGRQCNPNLYRWGNVPSGRGIEALISPTKLMTAATGSPSKTRVAEVLCEDRRSVIHALQATLTRSSKLCNRPMSPLCARNTNPTAIPLLYGSLFLLFPLVEFLSRQVFRRVYPIPLNKQVKYLLRVGEGLECGEERMSILVLLYKVFENSKRQYKNPVQCKGFDDILKGSTVKRSSNAKSVPARTLPS